MELKGLTKWFGTVLAVNDVTLIAESGKVLSIIGPSGCGKTTLLKLLAGILKPEKGMVFFDDVDVTGVPSRYRNVGFVFQSLSLFPNLTVKENLAFPLDARAWPHDKMERRLRYLLSLARLEGCEERYPRELSGGQQQRVALARALAADSKLLLLDEPLASIDASLREELRQEITRIQRETSVTIVYVTHDQREASSVSDRVAVMFNGKIEGIGDVPEIFFKPPSSKIAAFLGFTEELVGRIESVVGNVVFADIHGAIHKFELSEGLTPGEKLRFLLRPESIRLFPSKLDKSCLEAEVTDVRRMGTSLLVEVRHAGGKLLASLTGKPVLPVWARIGEKIYASFDPGEAYLGVT